MQEAGPGGAAGRGGASGREAGLGGVGSSGFTGAGAGPGAFVALVRWGLCTEGGGWGWTWGEAADRGAGLAEAVGWGRGLQVRGAGPGGTTGLLGEALAAGELESKETTGARGGAR